MRRRGDVVGKPLQQPKTGPVTIGRQAFEKILAVDGLKFTPEMKERHAEYDRRGLSPEERRREIIKIYRKG